MVATNSSVSSPNGDLPSKLCRTIPSSRSPRLISRWVARAFRTFRMRFSMRTPVCTRSTLCLGLGLGLGIFTS